MSIGKKIRELREERGWSQGDLEKRSGIDRRTISLYERDGSDPTIGMIKKLAKGFDVSIDYLADNEFEQNVVNDKALLRYFMDVDRLSPRYRRLSKELLSAVIAKSEKEKTK